MKKLILAALLIAVLFCVTGAAPRINRPVEYPPRYTLWDGGNCCWFTWEMAHQEWGARLPWAGDAKRWVNLAGRQVTVSGKVYHIEAITCPVPGSIYVSTEGQYGHVAWVYAVDTVQEWGQPDKVIYRTLESSIWPPKGGPVWLGCWWSEKERDWPPDGLPGVLFLVLTPGE
jgi:hypothetical protein